jgi:hypothetical protein
MTEWLKVVALKSNVFSKEVQVQSLLRPLKVSFQKWNGRVVQGDCL